MSIVFDSPPTPGDTGWRTEDGTLNVANLTAGFTIDASAPGETTTGGPISLGPLTLQGPSIGLADFGFADGMVVLTIAVGVDRASLAFGGTPAQPDRRARRRRRAAASPSTCIGILGTFDLAVDVFGLLSGNFRVEPTGKWGLRVSSLEAHVPERRRPARHRHRRGLRPEGPGRPEAHHDQHRDDHVPALRHHGHDPAVRPRGQLEHRQEQRRGHSAPT